jgi:beta-lactamase regulating signal transducer with metallopeptidase domain
MLFLGVTAIFIAAITLLCEVTCRFVLQRRLGYQDSVWRIGLTLVCIAPLLSWFAVNTSGIEVPAVWRAPRIVEAPIPLDQTNRNTKGAIQSVTDTNNDANFIADVGAISEVNTSSVTRAVPINREATIQSTRSRESTFISLLLVAKWLAIAVSGLGAAYAFIRLWLAFIHLRQLAKQSIPIDGSQLQGLLESAARHVNWTGQLPSLRICPMVDTPQLTGFRRHALLLPSDFIELSKLQPNRVVRILTHEVAHAKRYDNIINLLMQLQLCVWWWHPLIHRMNRKLCVLREKLCDAIAMDAQRPEEYAQTLLDFAVRRSHKPQTNMRNLALRFDSTASQLRDRVSWILSTPSELQTKSIRKRTSAMITAAILVTIGLGSTLRLVTPQAIAQQPPESKPNEPALEQPAKTSSASEEATNEVEVTEENITRLPILASGREVSGLIVDADGLPTNATVYLIESSRRGYLLPTKPFVTNANEQGQFTFNDIDPGFYHIWAEHANSTTLFRMLRGHRISVRDEPERVDAIKLKLHAACEFKFNVIDAVTKAPVEGALVVPNAGDIVREATTDATGQAMLQGLSKVDWRFTVHKPGYAYALVLPPEIELGKSSSFTVELVKGVTVRGKVTDEKKQPLANSQVGLSRPLANFDQVMLPKIATDAEGRFEFQDVQKSFQYSIYADCNMHEPGTKSIDVGQANADINVDFVLKSLPQTVVTIKVVDEKDNPIKGARIICQKQSSMPEREVTTDAKGLCKMIFLVGSDGANPFGGSYGGGDSNPFGSNGGRITFFVSASGYASEDEARTAKSYANNKEIKVVMRKGHALKARIVKPDGTPARGVLVISSSKKSIDSFNEAITDRDGFFEFTDLLSTDHLDIVPDRPYVYINEYRVDIAESTTQVADIELQHEGLVRFRAIDAVTREVLPKYIIKAAHPNNGAPPPSRVYAYSQELENQGFTMTADQGTYFEVYGFPVDYQHKFIISAEGYETMRTADLISTKPVDSTLFDVAMVRLNPANHKAVTGKIMNYFSQRDLVVTLIGSKDPSWMPNWFEIQTERIEKQEGCDVYRRSLVDSTGNFRFDDVPRSIANFEIYYTDGSSMAQRFTGLKNDPNAAIQHFEVTPQKPNMLRVKLAPDKYPNMRHFSIRPKMNGYVPLDRGIAYMLAQINKRDANQSTDGIFEFKNLPQGTYELLLYDQKADSEKFNLVRTDEIVIPGGGSTKFFDYNE